MAANMSRRQWLMALLWATSIASSWAEPKSPKEAWVDQQTGLFGDQGDGTYRNPVLAADYSDPDVIRVGEDYYLVASTFESSPGITVLHSRDLVNWKTIGAAFPDMDQLGPDYDWSRMNNYKDGLYAPSIRYHQGKFYVFANSFKGEGFFVASATDPRGPWTVTQIRDRNGKPLRVSIWTDPCPFWDTDGKAYLFTSHPKGGWYGYIFQMTADGTQLLDGERDAMEDRKQQHPWPDGGTIYSPFHGTEGNKAYKQGEYYYLMHIEFLGTGNGKGTYIMRSKNLYGTKADGTPGMPGDPGKYEMMKFGLGVPGQGGFVDTPDGRWFLIAQSPVNGAEGRVPHLLPVSWIDDWPVPGVDIQSGKGNMAWQLPKPIQGEQMSLPVQSDDFSSDTLAPSWEWNHQPRADHWSLKEHPGLLRLHAFPPVRPGFFGAGNTLSQRSVRSELTVVTVKLGLCGLSDGQEGGVAHFNGGLSYASLGVVQMKGKRVLVYSENGKTMVGPELSISGQDLWIRSSFAFDAVNHYSYSLDGKVFTAFGGAYQMQSGNWRGDRTGIYTFNSFWDTGFLDVYFYHLDVEKTRGPAAKK